jgi:hypothetical protein
MFCIAIPLYDSACTTTTRHWVLPLVGSSSRGSEVAIHPKVHTLYKFRFSKIAGKGEGGWLGGGRKGLSVSRLHERTLTISLIAVPPHSR